MYEKMPFADLLVFNIDTNQPHEMQSWASMKTMSCSAVSGAPPAQDLWEINSRFVFTEGKNRIIGNIYTGTAQARGDDTRTIMRTGVNIAHVV